MANRHVAQCCAENIMLWCTYLETFSLNESIAPHLATEYHKLRLKRFSESFFTKELSRRNLQSFDMSDIHLNLNDIIRQSAYYTQIPDLIIACDELDGASDNIPIIFEEVYVNNNENGGTVKSSISTSSLQVLNDLKTPFNRRNSLGSFSKLRKTTSSGKNSPIEPESKSVTTASSINLPVNSHILHKKLKKKADKKDSISNLTCDNAKSSITLVSYKKVN
jgi:hypothetical protein